MIEATKAQAKIASLLEQLHKALSVEYPSYHWNHIRVWQAYWQLKDILKE